MTIEVFLPNIDEAIRFSGMSYRDSSISLAGELWVTIGGSRFMLQRLSDTYSRFKTTPYRLLVERLEN